MSGNIPQTTNMRHLSWHAKMLLKQCRCGDERATGFVRQHVANLADLSNSKFADEARLHHAQLATARGYGCANWSVLRSVVDAMTHADLSALTPDQISALLTDASCDSSGTSKSLSVVNFEKLANYERGRPRRENGGIIISEKLGLTHEEAMNDRAKIHNMPPVGTRYANAYGIEWVVEVYDFFVAATTFARYPGDCDYLPVVNPQNPSRRLQSFISEVDRCTSKWVLFVDTMPGEHPIGLGHNLHCAHISSDPTEAHIFLDVKNAHETTIAHELAHLWLWFVEGMDGERALRDPSDNGRKNQLDFIQSFVQDIKVNNIIDERGFDMSLIAQDQFHGLVALRDLMLTPFIPPSRREPLLYALQIAGAVIEQRRWPTQMQESLPRMLEFFQVVIPEIYSTAMEFADIVTRCNLDVREGRRAALDECTVLGFRFTDGEFDPERELMEVTPTECMQDKFPQEFVGLPVPLKLEINKARARLGLRSDGGVTISASSSGMAMLMLRDSEKGLIGPIQVNFWLGIPEHGASFSTPKIDPEAPYRHIPMMERQRIRGMIPDDYGRLPGDNGYNTSYPLGKDPFTMMQKMNIAAAAQGGSTHNQFGGSPHHSAFGADQHGRLPGHPDYMMPIPPGHPSSAQSCNHANWKHSEPAAGAAPEFPWMDTGRNYMAGLTRSVVEARLAQQSAMNSTNLYTYAENNPVNRMDPTGLQPTGQRAPGESPVPRPGCKPVVYMCLRDILEGLTAHTFFWIHYPCANTQDRYIGYGPGGYTKIPEIGDDREAVEGGTAHCHRTDCSVDCITKQGQRIGKDWKISVGLGSGQFLPALGRKDCHAFVNTAVNECNCGWSFHAFIPDPKPKAK